MDKKTFVLNSIKIVIFTVNGTNRTEDDLTVPATEMYVHPNMFVLPSVGSRMNFKRKSVSFAGSVTSDTVFGIVESVTFNYELVEQEMAGNSLHQTVEIVLDLNPSLR